VPLLIIDDFGMRKLPLTAAEDLLEIVMRRYERASTLLISNRPVEDWGKLLGDTAAVSSMLDRLLHHGHVLKCGPAELANEVAGGGDGDLMEILRHGKHREPKAGFPTSPPRLEIAFAIHIPRGPAAIHI